MDSLELLNKKQQQAIALLVENSKPKAEIAKILGISRQTLYNWINNDKKFVAELDRFAEQIKLLAEKNIKINLEKYVENIHILANTAESEKVRLEANQYLIDRVLGKTTAKLDVTAQAKQPEQDSNILEDFNELSE